MTTTATILSNDVQADGRQEVTYQYTHTESGYQWMSGTRTLAAGVDAQAFGDALAAEAEADQIAIEREQAYEMAINGGNPDVVAWNFNPLADIRKYTFRRIFNLMRDAESDPQKSVVCGTLSQPGSYMNAHNSVAISGFVDDANWNNPTVNTATSKISAVGVNIDQLDHGEAELALDF